MVLFVNSLTHFLVDALSVTALFSDTSVADMLVPIILYNSLAFSTQCLVGLVSDALKRHIYVAVIGVLLVVLGYLIPGNLSVRLCFVGIGNSLFHVGGGAITLEDSRGKAWKLGVFVAPGAFGVTVGTLLPGLGTVLMIALLLCAVALFYFYARKPATLQYIRDEDLYPDVKNPVLVVLLLTIAVAVRAVGGAALEFPWKTGVALSFLTTFFVFAGKTAGGIVCDRLGATKSTLISIPLAAILIAFFSDFMIPSLVGQLLLNLSMPVTLWLLYQIMPDSPGFAFGLAASALWPGTIAGQLFVFAGLSRWLCVILCFVFGLFAVIYADHARRRNER